MAQSTLIQLFPSQFLMEDKFQKSLGEEFSLCDNGNMVFHWSDFDETCELIKTHMDNDPALREDFQKREAGIKKLAHIPVWIRSNRKVHQLTMFDLYERHVLNHGHNSGIDSFEPLELSFISGTGPFKAMAIAECFNKNTYQDFVLVYLLKGQLPKRTFRIRLKAKVLAEYGENFAEARLVQLEQLTTEGFLVSLDSQFYLQQLSKSEKVRLLIDANLLTECVGLSLENLKTHLSKHTFNLLYSSRKEDAIECALSEFSTQSSFDFFRNKKVFIFVPYSKVKGHVHAEGMKKFVSYARDLVRDHYQQLSKKLKSA